ncbi:MAG: S41 family peptidase [Bdellovibrionota bacterium]
MKKLFFSVLLVSLWCSWACTKKNSTSTATEESQHSQHQSAWMGEYDPQFFSGNQEETSLGQNTLCKYYDFLFSEMVSDHLTAKTNMKEEYTTKAFEQFILLDDVHEKYQSYLIAKGKLDPQTSSIQREKGCKGFEHLYPYIKEVFDPIEDQMFASQYLQLMLQFGLHQLDPSSNLLSFFSQDSYLQDIETQLQVRFFRRSDYSWRTPDYLTIDERFLDHFDYQSVNKDILMGKKIIGFVISVGNKEKRKSIKEVFDASIVDILKSGVVKKALWQEEDGTTHESDVFSYEGREQQYPSAFWYWVDSTKEIAVIQIDAFSVHLVEDIKEVFFELHSENPEYKGLILDLRNNPGGLIQAANHLLSLFLPQHSLLNTRVFRNPEDRNKLSFVQDIVKEHYNEEYLPGQDKKIVLLTNRSSASAAEFFLYAMNEHERAVTVGEHMTFGKGVGQTIKSYPKNFKNGIGALVTDFAMFSPKNNFSWQATSIGPNHIVFDDPVLTHLYNHKSSNEIFVMADYENKIETFPSPHLSEEAVPFVFTVPIQERFQPAQSKRIIEYVKPFLTKNSPNALLSCFSVPGDVDFDEQKECLLELSIQVAKCYINPSCVGTGNPS